MCGTARVEPAVVYFTLHTAKKIVQAFPRLSTMYAKSLEMPPLQSK